MRYKLSTDYLTNCLVPHYLSGRRFILWVQSLVWPLQTLNDRFCEFAREKRIEEMCIRDSTKAICIF